MSDERKSLWPWIAAVLIGLPVLYLLSSGPSRSLLIQKRIVIPVGPRGVTLWIGPTVVVEDGNWKTIYSPLDWAATQTFGAPLRWYWNLFPIRSTHEWP
jgi:hypothetical protein